MIGEQGPVTGEPFRVIVAAHDDVGQELYVYGFAHEMLDGWDYGRWTTTVEWTGKPQRAGEWPGEFARAELDPAAPAALDAPDAIRALGSWS